MASEFELDEIMGLWESGNLYVEDLEEVFSMGLVDCWFFNRLRLGCV